MPVRANHRDICKFDDADDDNYKIVKAQIMKLIAISTGEAEKEV